jgi:hypothetical protein
LGVTHVSFRPDRGDLSVPLLAREAVFMTSLEVYGRDRREIGGYGLASLTETPRARAPKAPFEIAWLGCDFDPPLGLYTPAGLADYKPTRELGPVELASSPEAVLAKTDALIWRPSCTGFEAAKAAIERDFRKVTTAGDVAVWVRRLTAAEPAKPE